jgi:HEAT repeat protein
LLPPAQLQQHIKTLEKGDDASRRQAIHSLMAPEHQDWAAAPAEIINALVQSLQNQLLGEMKHVSIRQQVVGILGNLGPRAQPAIPQLIELLKDGIPDGTREAAAAALGKIGKESRAAVDPLISLISHSRATLAIQAVRALGNIGCADHRVRTALVDLWLSPTQFQNLKVQVAIALCKLKLDAPGLLRVLTTTLVANQDAALRKAAAEGLALCGKTEIDVVPALLTAALNDKDEKLRLVAEEALGHLHLTREKAIQLCAKQLKDSAYAEPALRHSGPLAVPALIGALAAEDATSREKAARTLGCLGEAAAEAVPALTSLLRNKDLDVRLAAAKGLWNVTKNPDAVVPVLIHLLEDGGSDGTEPRRRYLQTVIEALWRIGPPAKAAVPVLTTMSKNKNRHISESALSALKEIAPPVAKKA